MARRAVQLALAAVLVAASLAHASCDTICVNLGATAPALPVSAQLQSRSTATRQAILRLSQPGFCSSVSSGDPAIPCKRIYVALPPNVDPQSVKILPTSYSTAVLPGTYDIGPVPAVATSGGELQWGVAKRIVNGRNRNTYGRNAFYPDRQARVVSVGSLRTWRIAAIEYWPYAYNPASGQLRRVTSNAVELSYSCEAGSAPHPDQVAPTMAGFVVNQADAAVWYRSSPSIVPRGYAIITTNAIVSASRQLADFTASLTGRGFRVKIATETDWGGGIGDTAAERIRAWLKSNYLALNLQYVLLIGNPDPVLGNVPMKMLWPRRWASSYREAPSDCYYADLTGNWDRDCDGYAGEEPDDFGIGGIDEMPEVYVGRIPYYGRISELDSVLLKTMLYKSSSHGYWGRQCLMAMKAMDESTPSYQLGEQITADFLTGLDINPNRVYDSTYGLATPPEHCPCDYDTFLKEWSSGAGLVFWMTHGSYNTASGVFISSRCAYLDDTRPSIVYMASCSNGQPEYAGSLGYTALARGAATTLSASRVSWYYIGEEDFTCSDSIGGLGYQYAKYLIKGQETCGRAAVDARLATPRSIWTNHLVFNLYGDPSIAYDVRRTVADARQLPDEATVKIDYCLVSRMGDGSECFVEDANRCRGIRVTGAWGDILRLDPGTPVSITGRMGTENRMRVLQDAHVTSLAGQALPAGTAGAVGSLAMSNRDVIDSKNHGLLVTSWGRVQWSLGGSFVISDGSLASGLRVTCKCSVSAVPGGYAKVTGISTPDGLEVYSAADLVQFGN